MAQSTISPQASSPPATEVPGAAARHRNNFNFLRLLLATLVLLAHSPELIDGDRSREILTRLFHTVSFGEVAVAGFFLLSGYLIVQSWEREPRPLSFFQKRVLRIYPAFIAASLVCVLVVGPLASDPRAYFAQLHLPIFLAKMLLLRTPDVPPVFEGTPYPVVNGAMWTISYEFRCYLLVALLGMLGAIRHKKLWLLVTAGALALSLAPQLVSHIQVPAGSLLIGDWDSALRLVPFFCVGGCFYLLRQSISYDKRWAALCVVVLIPCLFQPQAAQLALCTVGAYAFFCFAFAPIPALQRFGTRSDVSYGLYLYGWPTQKLLLWYIPSLSPWLLFVLAWAVSFACGTLSWRLIEKPFLKLKPRPAPST